MGQQITPGTYEIAVSGSTTYFLVTSFHSGLPPFAALPVGRSPNSVAVADVNGDGRSDIVTANFMTAA